MQTQPLLFSEPSYSETAVWCELSEGIDPARWARICRAIGTMPQDAFERFYEHFMAYKANPELMHKPDTPKKRTPAQIPLVSIGPGGIGGYGQWEI